MSLIIVRRSVERGQRTRVHTQINGHSNSLAARGTCLQSSLTSSFLHPNQLPRVFVPALSGAKCAVCALRYKELAIHYFAVLQLESILINSRESSISSAHAKFITKRDSRRQWHLGDTLQAVKSRGCGYRQLLLSLCLEKPYSFVMSAGDSYFTSVQISDVPVSATASTFCNTQHGDHRKKSYVMQQRNTRDNKIYWLK